MPPLVSFLIPVRNDAQGLARCMASIRRNDYPAGRLELIVADNGSTDGSDVVARQGGATLISMPSIRLGELRNRAARAARGSVLAFVDADHEICSDWVRNAVTALQESQVAVVGAPYRAPEPGTWVQRMYDLLRRRDGERRETAWLGSGNMAVVRSAFERVGGFAPDLETCEDVDFCRRVRQCGWRILTDDRLRSTHFGDPLTLRAVFKGELWRGRDNLRASLRGPLRLYDVPSVAIPVVDLAMLAGAVLGPALAPELGLKPTLGALSVIGALSAFRAALMLARRPIADTFALPQAFAVALAYDLGRALAIVGRIPHRRVRPKIASSPV